MRWCVFEDRLVSLLDPLTLTRPAFDLWCGASSLLQRQLRVLPTADIGLLVRPSLAELCRLQHPEAPVNDADWFQSGPAILVNARWLPTDRGIANPHSPHLGVVDHQGAYVVPPPADWAEWSPDAIDGWIDTWRRTLPSFQAGGAMIDYPWDLVEHNSEALTEDARWFARRNPFQPTTAAVIGPTQDLAVHAEATVEPLVVADTRNGPVLIDRGAVVQSFSRLEGPCYIGPGSWVVGAKLRGGTIGPCCRIGGEVEASILQGFSNKYHDGFLGHSYLGEWVNLGAGTQVSDLRNDYGQIKVIIGGERLGTGLTKVGVFLGYHVKTCLGTLLNSGTTVGAFANLLPAGSFLPVQVPSFCLVRHGQLQERTDLRQMFHTAAAVMHRRGSELTGAHVDFFFNLYDETAPHRSKVIRDSERRRLRNSV